jgi:sulfotransferase family protein
VLCAERPPRTQREILDRYLTAFFNAWIDCQGLRVPGKRWVSGFGPRLAWGESRRRFVADYPDGRLVMAHRDPRAWYASASSHKPRYAELGPALALWRRGAEEIVTAKSQAPDSVFVVTYEGLVRHPEPTMRALADWLGLEWHPLLLQPTFNRLPTPANSTYGPPAGTGIRPESLDRWQAVLPADVVAQIDAETMEIDAAVRAIADS